MIILWLLFIATILILVIYTTIWWIKVFNRFIYWGTRAQKELASINILIQKRFDNMHALVQIVKTYDTHEYKTIKETIESRKTETLNPNSMGYINALLERYPDLKANELHNELMIRNSQLENQINQIRTSYNYSTQRYNQSLKQFPQNIVATTHRFLEFKYLNFAEQESYKPRELFVEN